VVAVVAAAVVVVDLEEESELVVVAAVEVVESAVVESAVVVAAAVAEEVSARRLQSLPHWRRPRGWRCHKASMLPPLQARAASPLPPLPLLLRPQLGNRSMSAAVASLHDRRRCCHRRVGPAT
jgi:hypothetical protein